MIDCGIHRRCGLGKGRLYLVFCCSAGGKTGELGLEGWRGELAYLFSYT